MREFCNLAYAWLAQGRDRVQMAELETALATPDKQQETYDRVNAESMASLAQYGMPPPPPKRA